jgi:biotin carboxylase
MYENLAGKKILILGGNPETGAVVEAANSLGVQTYVLDPNPHAPSKKSATVSIHMDAMDVNAVADVVKVNEIDGVLVGVADVLVPSYQKICEKLKLPCYANEKIMQAFSTKDGFIQHCLKYDVPVTPVYDIATSLNINYEKIQYPVIVKPVDGAAGVGMTVCKNPAELRHGLIKGLSSS